MAASRRLAGFVLALLATASAPALAVTDEDLLKDDQTTGDVLTYGMGYKAQRYSPLDQISKATVKRLVPGLDPVLRRREAARPGKPADRRRRYTLRHRVVFAPVRGRRQNRRGEVAVRRAAARRHPALLRRHQSGCRDLQGQDLLHDARRPARRPEQGHGQDGVAQEDGELRRRLLEHGGPADRQGQGDRRQFRRRVRHRRRSQGLRCRDRRRGLVSPHRRGPHGSAGRQGVDHDRRR